MSRLPLPILLIAAAACSAADDARASGRQGARRDACIAEELAVQANTQLSAIDTLSAGNELLHARLHPFAQAFFDFAKARERELALMDSAATAATPRDSAAFATRAGQARPTAPTNEVEANAAEDYQRRFATALGNPAHPCHAAPAP